MNDTDTTQNLALKQEWTEAGTDFYINHEEAFSLQNLANHLDADVEAMYQYFPDGDHLILFYYELQLLKYRQMITDIEGFEQLSLSEKCSNFAYTLFDLFAEQREFVTATFEEYILHNSGTPFHNEVEALFKSFIESDPRISMTSQFVTWPVFYKMVTNEYLHLVHFWVDDISDHYEKSMAFTDKVASFFEELMYSKIIDKGFDLTRFLASNGVISHRYPLISYLIPTWLFKSDE